MKIAFVNPNRHTQWNKPPLGLLSVATMCQQTGHEVVIIDANLHNLSPEAIANKVKKCHLVGVTAMTPNIVEAIAINDAIKILNPVALTVLGGAHASSFALDCLLEGFDFVVVGEGEGAMLDILKDVENGRRCGIYTKFVDYRYLPIPNYELLNIPAYTPRYPHGRYGLWTSASISRGCPFLCTFCSKEIFGYKYRSMRTVDVLKMVETLVNEYHVKEITFYDDIFTVEKKRVVDICMSLIDKGIKVAWECESRVNIADYEVMLWMQKAGCHSIYYGIESGVQGLLNDVSKNVTLDQIRRAIRMTKEAGINPVGYFMLGLPGETRETVQMTLDFCAELELDHAQFSVCCPLPGSKLFKDMFGGKRFELKDWASFQYLGDVVTTTYMQDGLTKEYLESAVKEANVRFAKKTT